MNLKINKKRIQKNLQKFQDLLESNDLNIDESSILDLIVELPDLIGIQDKNKKKIIIKRLLNCVRWERVGYKSLIKAFTSDLVEHEVISNNAVVCLERSAIGGELGFISLQRCSLRSINEDLNYLRHTMTIFNKKKFLQKTAKAFRF